MIRPWMACRRAMVAGIALKGGGAALRTIHAKSPVPAATYPPSVPRLSKRHVVIFPVRAVNRPARPLGRRLGVELLADFAGAQVQAAVAAWGDAFEFMK